ncbi:hypothetical protein [Mycobacterium sp. NPDC050441]|uniref:hypothetical protein n=1 Tax=Mycobacterium sp. NPDC050441 TaxID=3155403 RepID=UPI00340FE012
MTDIPNVEAGANPDVEDFGVEEGSARLPVDFVHFVRQNILWCLGLLPFAIAAVNILSVSAGDPAIFGYIIRGLNIGSLVIGVVLPLIPVFIIWTALMWTIANVSRFNDFRTVMNLPALVVIIAVTISLATIQLGYLAIIVFSLLMWGSWKGVAAVRTSYRRRSSGPEASAVQAPPYDFPLLIAFLVLTSLMSLIYMPYGWLPSESVKVKESEPATGKVLSSDEVWTTYLGRYGKVVIAHSDDVEWRHPCDGDGSMVTKSINALPGDWNRREPCPDH